MKQAVLFYGGMALGVLASAAGVYLATSIHYHERAMPRSPRAYAFLTVGMICLLVGLARVVVAPLVLKAPRLSPRRLSGLSFRRGAGRARS